MATVEVILEAAARILERDGLDALTTNAIAELAGVSIGSLYQYFPGRDSVLAALVREQHRRLGDALTALDLETKASSLEMAIERIVAVAVAYQLDRPRLARALEFVEPGLPIDHETGAILQRVHALVVGVLERHAQALPAAARGQTAFDLIAMTRGMIDAAGIAGEIDHAALQKRVVRALLGYLAGPR